VKSIPIVKLLLFLLSSAATAFISSAQTPAPRQLTLIHPDDPDFDTLLNGNFTGVDNLDGYSAIRPYLVLLRNDTAHSIRAYAIAWDIQSSNRMVSRLGDEFVQRHQEPRTRLRAFTPGEIRLVSALFDLSPEEYKSRLPGIIKLLPGWTAHPPFSSTNIKSVSASLDAIIYDDGAYAGPDHFLFLTKYQCIRAAERDLGESLLKLMDSKASDQEILALLQQSAKAGLTANTSGRDRESICALYRGEEAQALLARYRSGGMDSLMTRAWALTQYPREILTRISSE
jgi:hypothetical protein